MLQVQIYERRLINKQLVGNSKYINTSQKQNIKMNQTYVDSDVKQNVFTKRTDHKVK